MSLSLDDNDDAKKWPEMLLLQIKLLKPYQVTVFSSNAVVLDAAQQHLLKTISINFPVTEIDVTAKAPRSVDKSMSLPIFNNPKHACVFITLCDNEIIVEKSCFYQLKQQMDFFNKKLSKHPRPKWLMVFPSFHALEDEEQELYFKNICMYAWNMKFIDFSIIQIANGRAHDQSMYSVYHYNPFYESFNKELLRSNAVIFPNKLQNGNFLTIKASCYCLQKYQKKQSFNELQSVSLLNFTSQHLNLKINLSYDRVNYANFSYWLEMMVDKLKNNELSLLSHAVPLLEVDELTEVLPFIYDKEQRIKTVILVPIIITTKFEISIEACAYLFGILMFVVFAGYIVYLSKNKKKIEKMFDLVQILLGMVINKQPKTSVEKIFFISIALSSLIYSNEVFTLFVNTRVVTEEMEFHSAREIVDFGMKLYTVPNTIKRILLYNNTNMERITEKIVIDSTHDKCIKRLIRYRNIGCIMSQLRAKHIVNKYRGKLGMQIMKLSKFVLSTDPLVYTFEKASPFLEDFDKITTFINEGGLNAKVRTDVTLINSTETEPYTEIDELFTREIIFLWIFGQSFALIVFFLEIIIYYIC